MFGNSTNKLHALRCLVHIKFMEYLLQFGPESSVFQFATYENKLKYTELLYYLLFYMVEQLCLSHTEGRIWAESVREQGSEEDIWSKREIVTGSGDDYTSITRGLLISTPRKIP